jgi:hypothetical protein
MILGGMVIPYLYKLSPAEGFAWFMVGMLIIGIGIYESLQARFWKRRMMREEKSAAQDEKTQGSKGENP